LDVCGFPKNIYYYYQSWWTDEDILHISPHWNWPDKIGKPIDVWVNTNADDVELFLNGKSLGKKVMPRNSHLQWEVNYEPGTLEAVAYKKGKKLTTKIETTGQASKVNVSPDKTVMLADGKDADVINISFVDKDGKEVPDANNMISFTISGDAKIIGVGNGDPSSHEADKCVDGMWKRSAFNGKCQVIIQAGKTAGSVILEAKSNGLVSDSITIQIK
jgi:beta-galactosidase